jgi:hypothetical protein
MTVILLLDKKTKDLPLACSLEQMLLVTYIAVLMHH